MITGIDETGDFNRTSELFNFFIAVHIDQNGNKYQIKESQFKLWEETVPLQNRAKDGEVKGQLLRDDQLYEFFEHVIDVVPKVGFSVIRIIPAENKIETLEQHRQIELNQMQQIIDDASRNNNQSWVKVYTDIYKWYKNRNYNELIKIKCLERLLGLSFNKVIIYGQFSYVLDKGDETNLNNIQFKIDKDFIRAENVKLLWGELFRSSWLNYTRENSIPIFQELGTTNPVFKIFNRKNNNMLEVKKLFRKNAEFVASNSSFEVRIADILGTIIHRNQNYNKCDKAYSKLKKSLGKNNFEHFYLNQI